MQKKSIIVGISNSHFLKSKIIEHFSFLMTYSKILIIDFGSQYTQLIARRIRDAHVFCQIAPYDQALTRIEICRPQGLILSGGPNSVYDEGAPHITTEIFEMNLPILGICYGLQLSAFLNGGKVLPANRREYGPAIIKVNPTCPLFYGLKAIQQVWMSHGDYIEALPDGFRAVGSTDNTPFAAIAQEARKIYGVQFHPEVVHTKHGTEILHNFLFEVCNCRPDWRMSSFIKESITEMREKVGSDKVVLGLSGGVDSSVAAVLLHRALGDQLTCIFVDNGLLRKDEANAIRQTFHRHFHITLVCIEASESFLAKLKGVIDPEKKRKAIGNEFIRIFEWQAKKINKAAYLAQGTLYPDVIESVPAHGGPSKTIKTHHNVGGLPQKMNLKLIEPFRELFKDEVREIGRELGLPESIIERHPFPGPGLAVRVIGEITKNRLEILREADDIFIDELHKNQLYSKIWQAFAVFLPIQTVGVMGDSRTYDSVIALRAVTSSDGMTADWAKIPDNILGFIANRIVNEVKGVNRVVYDITSKPPGTIEWE